MNNDIWNKIRNKEKLTDREIDELINWRLEESGVKKPL